MPWATAKVKGVVIAETDFPQVVGGDVYFPSECVKWEYLQDANHQKKGSQRQFNLYVNGTTVSEAAWCHPEPPRKLELVKNHVAFVGMAPVMIMYKKNFRYARSDDSHSDSGSVHTVSSTPNTSMPTTPTLGYSVPTIQLTYNPSIYDHRNLPVSLCRKGSHCSATSGWKGVGLPTVSETDRYLEVDVGEHRY